MVRPSLQQQTRHLNFYLIEMWLGFPQGLFWELWACYLDREVSHPFIKSSPCSACFLQSTEAPSGLFIATAKLFHPLAWQSLLNIFASYTVSDHRYSGCLATDICSDSVGHIFWNIPQEDVSIDWNARKRNTGVPNKLQTLGISPFTANSRGLNHHRRQTWYWCRCKLQSNIGRKLGSYIVDEDVVIDCVANWAADDADGERESYASRDEITRAESDSDSGRGNENSPDTETRKSSKRHLGLGIIGRGSGKYPTKCS